MLLTHHAHRLVQIHGSSAGTVGGDACAGETLGCRFGATPCEREVRHPMEKEWALTPGDVPWRRSKHGFQLSRDEAAAPEAFMIDAAGRASPAAVD